MTSPRLPGGTSAGDGDGSGSPADRAGLRVVATLLARGADVGSVAAGGHTPLHLAAGRGDPALLEALLARGADAIGPTEDGRSGLDIAEERGHARVARRLRGEMP